MKKLNILIKTILVIILVFVLGWYLFGEDGPFNDQLTINTTEEAEEVFVQDEEPPAVEEIQDEEPVVEVNPVTKIVFTGDVEISTYAQAKYDAYGIDGILSESLLNTLRDANYLMINNEFCFSERGEAADKQFTFRVNPKYTSLLNEMGVDIAGLANNHSLDYGRDALADTFTTLTDAGIEYAGAGFDLDEAAKLVVKTDEMGRTYGFMASSHVIPTYDWDIQSASPGEFTFYNETELIKRVEEYSKQVDYLFVMVHWGVERTTNLEEYQINDAHKMIDAGAAAVIGMHSHCLQPVEFYNGKPIFYSLGNFIFNQTINDGACVELTIDENNELNVKMIPIIARDTKTEEAINSKPELFDYVRNMSETVVMDDNGIIVSK